MVWEGCQTFSGAWGYHRDEATWKSVKMCIEMLINHVSMGGNLLLNVGPTARGYFDARALERLRGIGEWMRLHSRSIYECTRRRRNLLHRKTVDTLGILRPADCICICSASRSRLFICPE